MDPRVTIGPSGYSYPEWCGFYYPKGLSPGRFLACTASRFGSVELNGTFYSLKSPAIFQLLERRGCALVVADTAGRFPHAEELTADFVYVRLHGSTKLYESGYTDPELQAWADKIERWASPPGGRDVYVLRQHRQGPRPRRRGAARGHDRRARARRAPARRPAQPPGQKVMSSRSA